jgi:hypothetical protein
LLLAPEALWIFFNQRIGMKPTMTIAASIVFASALAACGHEPATETTAPASPHKTAPAPAVVPTQSDGASYNQELERLLKAAQGLRGAIQGLAQKQPGSQRTVAIAMAHQALNLTNQAMSQLPEEMRADPARTSNSKSSSGSTGSIGSQPDNAQSMEVLQKAAEQLLKSVQAMVDEPAGERRNAAVKAAHQALYDTNQAMIQLPGKVAEKK